MKARVRAVGPAAIAGAVLLTYGLCCVLLWSREEWEPFWDSALYILTGKSLAGGDGYLYLGRPFLLRPPGFSWLLSFLLRDGTHDFGQLNRFVMFFAGTAVAAVYLAMHRLLGTFRALAVAVLVGTCPLFASSFHKILSEFPFLTFLYLSLALFHRSAQRGRHAWASAAAGAASLAAAFYMRTVAVVMLPALLVLGWKRDRGAQRWRGLAPLAGVLVLVLPWWLHTREASARIESPAEQLFLVDYATAVFHEDPGDSDSPRVSVQGWLDRIESNGAALAADLVGRNLHLEQAWLQMIGVAVLLTGLALGIRRRPSLFEWLALAYLAILLTYFTNAPRLMLPLVPLLYLYLFEAVAALAGRLGRWGPAGPAPAAACGLVFVLMMAGNLSAFPSFIGSPGAGEEDAVRARQRQDLETIATWIRANTATDAVLLCMQAPLLALLTGRTAYTWQFARSPDLLSRYDVDYVVFDVGPPPDLERLALSRTRQSWLLPGARRRGRIAIHRVSE